MGIFRVEHWLNVYRTSAKSEYYVGLASSRLPSHNLNVKQSNSNSVAVPANKVEITRYPSLIIWEEGKSKNSNSAKHKTNFESRSFRY